MTVRWSEPQDYRHTANITSYEITANQTLPSQNSSLVVERGTVQFGQKTLSFIVPINTVVELTVHAEVCGTKFGNGSSSLTLCIEGEVCVCVCVCVTI